ncbi:MAG: prephenate dehydrogenase [Planctomycetota bacterium]|jgi:cyclohexadieny/prephenate dehydrogenase|nr:prephenate dehydrogenase [Planctomycetota bacterium]
MKLPWSTVAIVGVGLIGGSLGKALLTRGLARRVVGIGRSKASLAEAMERQLVSEVSCDLAAVSEADFVVVATSVGSIPRLLEAADSHVSEGTLITDAGSTKQSVVSGWQKRRRHRGRFVGSHPLAGSHLRGPAAADATLFEGRVAVVTPAASTPEEDVEEVGSFWASLGSTVFVMKPREHDRILAMTSHAPHVLAAALAAVTPDADRRFTAGGWRDTTRVAGGDAELWADILLDNAAQVTKAVSTMHGYTQRMLDALAAGDRRRLVRLLTTAKDKRNALGS